MFCNRTWHSSNTSPGLCESSEYVCMCVSQSVCMCLSQCVCMCVSQYVCMYVCEYAYL